MLQDDYMLNQITFIWKLGDNSGFNWETSQVSSKVAALVLHFHELFHIFVNTCFCLFLTHFYQTTVDSRCCVSFCCTAKWFSYTYAYIIFHYGLSQDIEDSSLCYTVRPCLFIRYIIVCICSSKAPNPSLPYPCPLGNHKSVVYISESVERCIHLCQILDFTCNWYHMVFVLLCLTYLVWSSPGPSVLL